MIPTAGDTATVQAAHDAYRQGLCVDCRETRYSPGRPRCTDCHAKRFAPPPFVIELRLLPDPVGH